MKKSSQHTIDLLFPITLFFVFSVSILIVLLLSANIYQKNINDSNSTFETGTTLSYLTEKIRQNDIGGTEQIYLTTFDGCDALAISHEYEEHTFTTYIYEVNGELKEIFLQEGVEASAESGTTIMEVNHLEFNELSDGLFQFVCTSTNGISDSVIISVHSEP